MGKDTTSTTREDTGLIDSLLGIKHYDTKITDGDRTVRGGGLTSEDSQKNASDQWDDD